MISKQLFEYVLDISKKGILLDKKLIRRLVRNIISSTDFMTRKRFKYTYFRHDDNFCGKTNINEGKICFSIETCYEEVNEYAGANWEEITPKENGNYLYHSFEHSFNPNIKK
jgi:hypothetical protein